MYYKDFNGISVSALGMGALRLPSIEGQPDKIDRIEAKKVIDAAIEVGINYFDTAYTYQNGDSERFLGEALSNYPRESYYLATKYYSKAGGSIEEVFEEQLKRLKTDYLDFYLLHSLDENYIADYTDKNTDYIGFMLKQKEAGRIRHIGFSTHADPATLSKFLKYFDGFDMAVMQLNYMDWDILKAAEQYEILTKHNIPVWVMEPLKGGRLASLNEEATRILNNTSPQRSVSSWGFRYLMGLSNVTTIMSGMSSVEQVYDNASTFAKYDPLSEEEKKALNEAAEAFFKDLGVPCSDCRYCISTCKAGLNIPLLIKAYNEFSLSGGTWKVSGLSGARSPKKCVQCGACQKRCPQKINIPAIMKKLASLGL